jgi:hypothetical protein
MVASIMAESSGIGPNAPAKIASAASPLATPGSRSGAGLPRGGAEAPEDRLASGLRLPPRLSQTGRKDIRWKAISISPLLAAKIDRNENLPVVALNQQGHGLAGLRHQRTQFLDRLNWRSVDSQEKIAGLNAGACSRAARVFDHQPFSACLPPLIRAERPNRKSEAPMLLIRGIGRSDFRRL